MVEKDFMKTHYLQRLNRDGVRIILGYELLSHEKEVDIEKALDVKIEGRLAEAFAAKRPRRPRSSGYKYKMIKRHEDEGIFAALEFSPVPPISNIPTNRVLLYLLSYLRIFEPSKSEVISSNLGIKQIKDLEKKSEVVNPGNLLVARENSPIFLNPESERDVAEFLDVYWKHPHIIRQKVQELEELGFFLPFSQIEADTFPTGVDGLDHLLNPYQGDDYLSSGFKHRRNILFVGGPGTGKTTLLVQILYWNLYHNQRNVLMLTFEEQYPVITKTFWSSFSWNIGLFTKSLVLDQETDPNELLEKIHRYIEEKQAILVAVDGLSRLRPKLGTKYSLFVAMFFRSLQIKGIAGLFSAEESTHIDSALEYQADGVIRLSRKGERRELVIEKLRGQDFIAGRHSFEIIDQKYLEKQCRLFPNSEETFPLQKGINVYPNEQYYASVTDLEVF
jgi:KaiC/GvpD/RAD55 family RecA-like ATPase